MFPTLFLTTQTPSNLGTGFLYVTANALSAIDAATARANMAVPGLATANAFTANTQTFTGSAHAAVSFGIYPFGGTAFLECRSANSSVILTTFGPYSGPTLIVDHVNIGLIVKNGFKVAWSTATSGDAATLRTIDTALQRAAARVVGITDGSSAGGTLASVPLTPTQLTADQNNYAPGVARTYRLSSDASRTITGWSISQVSGQEFRVVNVGSNNVVLAHESGSSTAANRMICTGAANITLAADEEAIVWYDATTQRFRVRKV